MRAVGSALGRAAEAGDCFLLDGEFGAGKTTLVQGLARGLGVQTPVSSPSFVIENQYRGRLPLYHIDLYRLDELDDALLDELAEDLFGDGVAAVEWPRHLPAELRAGATDVRLTVEEDQARRLDIQGPARLVEAVLETTRTCAEEAGTHLSTARGVHTPWSETR